MFDIVLVEPEIPPNAGNVIRLAANTGCRLHLVEPLGFSMDDRSLKRAGLDYHELAPVKTHKDWPACLSLLGARRRFAFTTKGTNLYTDVRYASDDVLVFGAETRGLPASISWDSRRETACGCP
jgi:tRNA (cytidine/uridine-2'-O-)-methyltransferase